MSADEIQISNVVTFGAMFVVVVAGFLVMRTLFQWYRRRSRGGGLS